MSAREIKRLKTDSKRLENNSAESAETAPAEIVVPADPELVQVPSSNFETEQLKSEIADLNNKYSSERITNKRLNTKLVDMTAERDKALQDIDEFKQQVKKLRDEFKQQVKKLRSENRKLKAEIKALKSSSEPGSDC